MTASIPIAAGALLAGVLLRAWCDSQDSRCRRITAVLLGPPGEDEQEYGPEEMAVILDRSRMALASLRFLRFASLLLVIVPAVALAGSLAGLRGAGPGAVWTLIGWEALVATACYTLIVSAAGLADRAAHRRGQALASNPPEWFLRDEIHPPLLVMAGWVAWERLAAAATLLFRPLGLDRPMAQLIEADNEIRLAVSSGDDREGEGGEEKPRSGEAIDRERSEQDMIRAIHRLDNTLVREIMRPVNQVTAIRLGDYSPRRLLTLCRRTGYTRIPCYEDHILNLIGFINVYNLLERDEPPKDLRPLVTRPVFVPEVARVDDVLREMIARKQQVAIVFDEFGGTSGWLSREDILEEIVGDLEDEYERPSQKLVRVKGGYLADGSLDLDDLAEETGLKLPKRNCDTLAGFIYSRLGRTPRRGETVEEDGWAIRVASMDRHRIRRVRVTPPPVEQANSG